MALTKLPGSKWWIETDDTSGEIIGEYNKAHITADIQALNATLASRPDPTQDASDVADLLAAIAGKWTDTKRARIVALVNSMYQDYQGDMRNVETSQMIARRDALVALRDRLV